MRLSFGCSSLYLLLSSKSFLMISVCSFDRMPKSSINLRFFLAFVPSFLITSEKLSLLSLFPTRISYASSIIVIVLVVIQVCVHIRVYKGFGKSDINYNRVVKKRNIYKLTIFKQYNGRYIRK